MTWVLQQWFTDFHVDGIRLDAVHELHDSSAVHWLTEARLAVAVLERQLNKALWLVAESDRNDPATVRAVEAGGFGMDGQWTDDVHHALHVALTGETSGYYADFEGFDVLGKALTRAFVHDGTWSAFRKRPARRARPACDAWPPLRRLHPEPRPGGQPRGRRPALRDAEHRAAEGGGGAAALLAVHADALHG